jgi:hypothetical protein
MRSPEDGVGGQEQSAAAPGWHADPYGKAVYRYWDGSQWTEHTAYDHAQPEGEGGAQAEVEEGQSPAARRVLEWTDAAKEG